MKKSNTLILIISIILFISLLFLFINKNDYLILKDSKTSNIMFILPLSKEKEFTIKWIHSVELTPWEEIFKINENLDIILDRTRFKSFGAGVPDYAGDKVTLEDGYVIYSNINMKMDNLIYGISKTAKHILIYNNMSYYLYKFLPNDIGASFLVKKLNVFQYFKYKKMAMDF